jgi:hypothetical protein
VVPVSGLSARIIAISGYQTDSGCQLFLGSWPAPSGASHRRKKAPVFVSTAWPQSSKQIDEHKFLKI